MVTAETDLRPLKTDPKGSTKRRPKWVINRLLPLVAVIVALQWTITEDGPVVQVESGQLRGKHKTGQGGVSYYSFKGIPYAKPPVGPLRFMPPERADNWTDIRPAFSEGPVCAQAHADIYWLPEEVRHIRVPSLRRLYNIVTALPHLAAQIVRFYRQSEDCLYLNVFTKELLSSAAQSRLRPVIVWIHGGAFYTGTANSHIYGPDFLLKEDVVVVSVNYRLGVLGFLALANAQSHPANAGLRDQAMALRWIQNNIENFGGDPNRVTLMGESAGGASVQYHMMSPLSSGLFHTAISLSGSSLNSWAYSESDEASRRAFRLAKRLGGNPRDEDELLEFLRAQKPADLIRESYYLFPDKEDSRGLLMPFVPTVEKNSSDAFLPASPQELLKRKEYSKVPFLTGINDREGMITLLPDIVTRGMAPTPENIEAINNSTEKLVPLELLQLLQKNGKDVRAAAQRIKTFYFGDDSVSLTNMPAYIDYWSDVLFTIGVTRNVRNMAANGLQNIFMYFFTFDGRLNLMKKLVNSHIEGVSHADELGYMFPVDIMPAADVDQDSIEVVTVSRMSRLIANFARTGNPTPLGDRDELIGGPWNPVNNNGTGYMDLGAKFEFHDQRLLEERMNFWDNEFQMASS